MDFELAFKAVVSRAAVLRLTETQAVEAAGVSAATWWRAREGHAGTAARVRALKRVEDALTTREAGETA